MQLHFKPLHTGGSGLSTEASGLRALHKRFLCTTNRALRCVAAQPTTLEVVRHGSLHCRAAVNQIHADLGASHSRRGAHWQPMRAAVTQPAPPSPPPFSPSSLTSAFHSHATPNGEPRGGGCRVLSERALQKCTPADKPKPLRTAGTFVETLRQSQGSRSVGNAAFARAARWVPPSEAPAVRRRLQRSSKAPTSHL